MGRINLTGLLALLLGLQLPGATIVVNSNPTVSAQAVVDNITGADMAGLQVQATYAFPTGPTAQTLTWQATSATGGAAASPNVSVSLNGPTNGDLSWHYTANVLSPLLSLEFDGSTAGIFFDRSLPDPGTPGSGPGQDIVFGPLLLSGSESSIVVTYSRAVMLGNSAPQGDLFAAMRIDFPNSIMGPANFPPQDFSFTQDTDRSVTPEPATWSPALLAILALIGVRFSVRLKRLREQAQ